MRTFLSCFLALISVAAAADNPAPRTAEAIWSDYVQAVGGKNAVDKLDSRQIRVNARRAPDVTLYWAKPNRVLSVTKKGRTGFDGSSCWELSSKGKVKKLAHGSELAIEMEANPLRFVYLSDLYDTIDGAPAEQIGDDKMEVIVAPSDTGSTKLFFDAKTHLLSRVEEKGGISVYFTNAFDYSDYQEVDGVRLPFHIVHTTTEPQGRAEDFRLKDVAHNVKLNPEMFSKPMPSKVVLGGKR